MTDSMVVPALVGSVVAACGSGVVWFLFRRPIEDWVSRTEKLEREIVDLRERRLTEIETKIEDHAMTDNRRHDAASASRKDLHEKVEMIRRDYVARETCLAAHNAMGAQLERVAEKLTAAVVDIGRVQEQLSTSIKRMEDVAVRQIALGEDLSALKAVRR